MTEWRQVAKFRVTIIPMAGAAVSEYPAYVYSHANTRQGAIKDAENMLALRGFVPSKFSLKVERARGK